MRTSINISEELLEEAKKAAGVSTKSQAIIIALNEMIQRRKSRRILELKGSMAEDLDYKDARRKR